MRVKICGITNRADAVMCAAAGADALGYVFFPESPRHIDPRKAAEIIGNLPPFIMQIGVFVDAPAALVNDIARKCRLNGVQLHGDEPPGYLQEIDFPVIKAFRVQSGFDFAVLNRYRRCGILLDACSGKSRGGTGRTFDWKKIPDKIRHSCILAGGINSENIQQVMDVIRPAGVDLSSGVESEPGRKDRAKVNAFFQQIRSCNHGSQ